MRPGDALLAQMLSIGMQFGLSWFAAMVRTV